MLCLCSTTDEPCLKVQSVNDSFVMDFVSLCLQAEPEYIEESSQNKLGASFYLPFIFYFFKRKVRAVLTDLDASETTCL